MLRKIFFENKRYIERVNRFISELFFEAYSYEEQYKAIIDRLFLTKDNFNIFKGLFKRLYFALTRGRRIADEDIELFSRRLNEKYGHILDFNKIYRDYKDSRKIGQEEIDDFFENLRGKVDLKEFFEFLFKILVDIGINEKINLDDIRDNYYKNIDKIEKFNKDDKIFNYIFNLVISKWKDVIKKLLNINYDDNDKIKELLLSNSENSEKIFNFFVNELESKEFKKINLNLFRKIDSSFIKKMITIYFLFNENYDNFIANFNSDKVLCDPIYKRGIVFLFSLGESEDKGKGGLSKDDIEKIDKNVIEYIENNDNLSLNGSNVLGMDKNKVHEWFSIFLGLSFKNLVNSTIFFIDPIFEQKNSIDYYFNIINNKLSEIFVKDNVIMNDLKKLFKDDEIALWLTKGLLDSDLNISLDYFNDNNKNKCFKFCFNYVVNNFKKLLDNGMSKDELLYEFRLDRELNSVGNYLRNFFIGAKYFDPEIEKYKFCIDVNSLKNKYKVIYNGEKWKFIYVWDIEELRSIICFLQFPFQDYFLKFSNNKNNVKKIDIKYVDFCNNLAKKYLYNYSCSVLNLSKYSGDKADFENCNFSSLCIGAPNNFESYGGRFLIFINKEKKFKIVTSPSSAFGRGQLEMRDQSDNIAFLGISISEGLRIFSKEMTKEEREIALFDAFYKLEKFDENATLLNK